MKDLKTIFDICFFQAKPQDVPYSHKLLGVTAIASVVSYILALETVGAEIAKILDKNVAIVPLAVAEHVFFAAIVWTILKLRAHTERFIQALTAMFGANTLAQLVMWPLAGWLIQSQGTAAANTPTLLLVGLRLWLLLIFAHIFRQTLETRFTAGILFTLGAWVLTSLLLKLSANLLV